MSLRSKSLLILAIVALLAVVALWVNRRRESWSIQVACYRVGSADTYEAARQELAWFEEQPSRAARLRELMASYGTGNQQFDSYLTRYLHDAQCGDELREAFSLELGWRPRLLEGWAAAWKRDQPDMDAEIASIRSYLDVLERADPPREITWREVLDLQAAFYWTGQQDLAPRLTPDNWRGRYQRWIAAEPRWSLPEG